MRYRRTGVLLALAATWALLAVPPAESSTGRASVTSAMTPDLDPTFGGSGSGVWEGEPVPGEALVQADGKVLLAGEMHDADAGVYNFLLFRLTSDGVPDATFSGDGRRTMYFGPNRKNAAGITPLLLPDGRILEVGDANGLDGDFVALVRYLPDGRLDPSFGDAGKAMIQGPPGARVEVADAVLRPDGRILVLAQMTDPSGAGRFLLVGLTPRGRPDPTWGGDGIVITDPDPSARYAVVTSLALQSDGRPIAAGYRGSRTDAVGLAVRYRADGRLDLSFGFEGRLELKQLRTLDDALALPSGRMFFTGLSVRAKQTLWDPYGDPFVVEGFTRARILRRLTDGRPDPAFSGDGMTQADMGALMWGSAQLVRQQSDRLVVGVSVFDRTVHCESYDAATKPVLVRFDPSGTRDAHFSGDGIAVGPADVFTEVRDVVVQPSGKVVVYAEIADCGWTQVAARAMRFPAD